MHPIPVKTSGIHLFKINMPDVIASMGQGNAVTFFSAMDGVEQAQLDAGSVFAEQSEIHAPAIPGGAQWVRSSFFPPHHLYFRAMRRKIQKEFI
jgi:hypothetical protein